MGSLMNLFAIYIGGKTETSLLEVHDIQFAAGEKIEDTYEHLRKQWWGTPQSLHLDAWGILKNVDGYDIHLASEPPADQTQQLFFVHVGGYDPREFTELHKNLFVIAENASEAKLQTKASIAHWQVPHKDNLVTIENCVSISDCLNIKNLFIHLTHTHQPPQFDFICKYVPIAK